MTPLDYARKPPAPPSPFEGRSPMAQLLDGIFLAIGLTMLAAPFLFVTALAAYVLFFWS